MDPKENLFGKTLEEIRAIGLQHKLPAYTSIQLTDWLYRKHATRFEQMTNLSKKTRRALDDNFVLLRPAPDGVQVSADGTRKYLFQAMSGKYIEAVVIPDRNRNTLCMSSQVGCKMGCVFCMTGKQGFQGNLSPGEIISQIANLPERDSLTNYVFMGMGEPLANLDNVLKSLDVLTSDYGFGISPARFTLSTIGMLPALETFVAQTRCNLAISLHSPFEEERQMLMPVEKVFPARRIVQLLKDLPRLNQRKLSFEYIMFKGINDTFRHVNGLTRLLNGLRCRLNLIRFHPIPGSDLQPSDEETIRLFKDRLNEKGLLTTIRASRGQDIFAACGMLSTMHQAGPVLEKIN